MLKLESLIDIAKESLADQHRCASAVYDKRGRLLSTAWNQPGKSHPLQAHYARLTGFEKRIFLHSEIGALIRAKGDPYTIQIVRIGPKEFPKPSFPCPICLRAIEESGVKEIIYCNKDGEFIIENL